MSAKHLTQGSIEPPKGKDKLRLYSMPFCPFADRARLILLVKQVPHDIVNIHLKIKPDWYWKINPKGLVPTLDTGSEIVTESLDIADYLDKHFPEPPLYSDDEKKRAHDKELIKEFTELTSLFYAASFTTNTKPLREHLEKMKPHLEKCENELKSRGGVFFGGEKPNMVDYMLWPWAPRAFTLKLIYNEELPTANEYPNLYAWCKAMRQLKPVQETEIEVNRLYELTRQYTASSLDYDSI